MARILVVDDDVDLRDLVAFTLESGGHDVTACVDGLEAWELLAERDFDLVVVDRMMPRLDGLQLIARCRADSRLRDLRMVMLTARALTDEVEQGLDAGADRYVTKPFSPRELRSVVASLLGT